MSVICMNERAVRSIIQRNVGNVIIHQPAVRNMIKRNVKNTYILAQFNVMNKIHCNVRNIIQRKNVRNIIPHTHSQEHNSMQCPSGIKFSMGIIAVQHCSSVRQCGSVRPCAAVCGSMGQCGSVRQ